MNDREMLELAAKAAGYDNLTYCEFWQCMAKWREEDGGYFDARTCWRPLRDDGDALRLAVKLNMLEEGLYPFAELMRRLSTETGEDDYAATRRAIVHAAAEIGMCMQ